MRILVLSLDQTLMVPDKGDTEKRFIEYGRYVDKIYIFTYSPKGGKRQIGKRIFVQAITGFKLLKLLKTVVWGVTLVRKNRVDLIVTNDPLLGFAGWLICLLAGRTKLYVNVFGIGSLNLLERWAIKKADLVRTDSQKDVVRLVTLGVNKKKIFYLPVIPSRSVLRRLKNFSPLKTKTNQNPVILNVGDLIPQKGQAILLQALALIVQEVPTVQLCLIGDGPQKAALEHLTRRLGLENNVKFVGKVLYNKLPDYYRSSTILAVSSWYEGGPRVVMEAAFCFLPVVSTAVGSVADMLTDKRSVFLVPAGDVKELAARILELLGNRKKQLLFARRARKQIEKYCDGNKNTKELIGSWRQALK
jgi:glycosyltransferase involved in cell wall biosynthesis